MTEIDALEIFYDVVRDPGAHVLEWKRETGGRVVGYLHSEVPEELVHAAGMLPVFVPGDRSVIDRADAHLQTWACSFMRGCLAQILAGRAEYLDGLIIPHTCDTTRTLGGILRHAGSLPFIENYLLPRQVERPSAAKYLGRELRRLKKKLEELAGREITDRDLRESIRVHNRNRSLLRELYDLHGRHPGLLTSRDLYTVIKASMMMPKERANQLLDQLLQKIRQKTAAAEQQKKTRLMISGPLWEPPEIMDIIDTGGGTIVADDMLTGYRYITGDVPEDTDPVEGLVWRQLNRIPFAGYDDQRNPRRRFIVQTARERRVEGIIFLHLKYCEPENYDYYDNKLAVEEAGMPNVRIETELGSSSIEQLRTRVQAFIEMIGGED